MDSVANALKKPKLKVASAKGVKQTKFALNQALDSGTRDSILALLFPTDRTLENTMDTKLVEYVKYFMEAIGESWDDNVVYSTTISATMGFEFDTFKKGSTKHPYDLDFLMQVKVAADDSVDITLGFDVKLKAEPGKYNFTRYAKIKISSTYDVKSNDFVVDYNRCSDYTKTPSINRFVAYEREYIVVKKGAIESFDDYYAMSEEKLVLDEEHPAWQDYYDEGVKFFPGAKIFNGNTVYKVYTTGAGGKMTSVVHKDKLMELLVDGMGLHEGVNDSGFFALKTTDTPALKTAESKMSKKYGDPLVYDLIGNLEGINFDAKNIDERPVEEEENSSSQETKAMRNIYVVLTPTLNLQGGPLSDIIVDKSTTLEDLLLGR